MNFLMNNKKGFTLVELLITMAVVSVIMVAVISAFDVQQKSQLKQQLISEVQQNGRAAMYLMTWDVRMAGYALGEGKISVPAPDGESWYYIKAIEIKANEVEGRKTDWVEILYADTKAKTNISQAMPTPSVEWKVDSTEGFDECDLVIISDATHSAVLEITEVQESSNKLQHNYSDCTGVNPKLGVDWKNTEGFDTGSEVHKLRYLTYAIQDENSAHPWLGVDKNGSLGGYSFDRYVEDIEDLQAVYIFEDGGEANAYNDVDMDDTNDYDDVIAVRITIVARTRIEHKGFKGKKPALEGNPAGPTDNYGRRVLSLELKIRNIAL